MAEQRTVELELTVRARCRVTVSRVRGPDYEGIDVHRIELAATGHPTPPQVLSWYSNHEVGAILAAARAAFEDQPTQDAESPPGGCSFCGSHKNPGHHEPLCGTVEKVAEAVVALGARLERVERLVEHTCDDDTMDDGRCLRCELDERGPV